MESIAPDPRAALRRRLLLGGVAVAAASAGAGVAWWRRNAAQSGTEGAVAPEAFWASSFDSPAGAPLAMRAFRGKPLLINFWATWCPPCIEELPLIDAFFRQHQGNSWQVLGLAIDQPSAVRAFLGRMQLSFPIGLAGLEGTELGKSLGNSGGVLPFSVALSRTGSVMGRKSGKLSQSDLSAWVDTAN